MKKIEMGKLEVNYGKGWGEDVDKFCSIYAIGGLSFLFGAKTMAAAAFCAGWGYGRAFM